MRFIPVEKLKPGMILGKNIKNTQESTLLRNGVELTDRFIAHLEARGYKGAYILDSISEGIMVPETIPQELFDDGVQAVKEANIEGLMVVAKQIAAEIISNQHIFPEMQDLRSYDDYTYHHSVNVGVYSTLIARKMKMGARELEHVCLAGVCHDLGKTRIPSTVINKPGKLTPEEYDLVKQHSRFSYDILADNYAISAKVKQAVLYHHENENGTGYPEGKMSEDIPLYSKILHVADVYDALTSKRPYKESYTTADALEYIMGGSGILFDREVVEALLAAVPAYQAGTEVELSNGEKAIVVKNSNMSLRPIVRLMSSGEDVDLSSNPDYYDVVIESRMTLKEDFVREVERLSNGVGGRIMRRVGDPRILVVDDMVTGLMALKTALNDKFKIIMAKSGMQALAYITKEGLPDLIILDIDMPGMNGFETLEEIQNRFDSDVPVIFLTALNNKDMVKRCKDMGASDYILKPVNPIYVRERVKSALDKYEDNLCR
ncbi:MAG: response regulator [Eubacterium sp.]|nr:response regulator [Eubacterium sp.]